MSYSPTLGTSITNTKLRTPDHVSPFSGMCAVCSENCTGTCEIGLSATRGPGGFAMEDDVYKGLALGAPFVDFIAIGRGSMAAAFAGILVN